MKYTRRALWAAVLLSASASWAQTVPPPPAAAPAGAPVLYGPRVLPLDEASKDPSFLRFRTGLIATVKKRDAAALLADVDRKIQNGFSGDDGIAHFRKKWHPERKDSEIWRVLETILTHGGSFGRSETGLKAFHAPYVAFREWPDGPWAQEGVHEYVAVLGKNVRLRREARPDGEIVGLISYGIVMPTGQPVKDSAGHAWTPVDSLAGQRGYIASDYLYSPFDYRAEFSLSKGRWRLTFLGAGD